MKAKVFALTLVATLLFGLAITATNAAAMENSDKASSSTDVAKPEDANEDTQTESTGKEVHKRGIFYNGGAFASHGGHASTYWPKTYASHYGYSLQLPGASPFGGLATAPSFAPSFLKYHQPSFHYKAAHAFAPPALTSYGSLPAFPTLGSAPTPHAHVLPQAVSHAHASAPFVIRPGGAVVSSYSVNYPQYHQKPSVAVQPVQPVQSVAHIAPVQHFQPPQPIIPVQHFHTVQPAQPVQSVAHITPVQHVQPPQPITPVQHFHSVQPVQPVQSVAHITPVQHFQPPQPITPVQHFHSVQPIQPVQSFQPVQPAVQVPQPQPIQPVQHLHPLHHYFQTTFVQPQRPIPAVPAVPVAPEFPAIPSFPSAAFPAFPAFPSLPALPSLPTIPTAPTVPTVQAPANSFFPIGVQPQRPQQPPTFVSIPIQPATQFPNVFPLPGTPAVNAPDSGSAEASPQIPPAPLAPAPIPEPEFPPVQQLPQPTQQPWRPVMNRPSNTLLPPYGSSPAEGYLPPAPQSHSLRQQQESNSNIFDNLSDAEIEHIFAQANLAAQQDQQHQHHHHHRDYQHHY